MQKCAIGEQNVVFILGGQRRERRDGGEGEERGLRKGAERGYKARGGHSNRICTNTRDRGQKF